MKHRLFCAGLLFAVALTTPLLGQEEEPNRATGVRGETLYSSSGSDDINLFNGNLVYRIPIGEPVPVGPQLSIAPVLVYNSGDERAWRECKDVVKEAVGDRGIGIGWRLHFGRLIPVRKSTPNGVNHCAPQVPEIELPETIPLIAGMKSTNWAYEDPNGGVHEFFDRFREEECDISQPGCGPSLPPPDCWAARSNGEHCFVYSHDGSFLRLDPFDPEHLAPTVYFPDGTFKVFGFKAGRYPVPSVSCSVDLEFADTVQVSHATAVGDQFGNQFTIQYYGDLTSGMPHPLAGVPENQRDALIYRVFPSTASNPDTPLFPSVLFQFDVSTYSYAGHGCPAVLAPRVTQIIVPTAASDGSGGWLPATWALTHGDAPTLTGVVLPTLPGQASLSYTLSYVGFNGRLSEVTVPSGGKIRYSYDWITHWSLQCSHNPFNDYCPGFKKDSVYGVIERATERLVRSTPSGSTTPEVSSTRYIRSTRGLNPCSTASPEDCRLRVDMWAPRQDSLPSTSFRVTRTLFGESDRTRNTALYGRPLSTSDYFVSAAAPGRDIIDTATPFRHTVFSYDFDGPRDALGISTGEGFDHNTRESHRLITWSALTSTRSSSVSRDDWDWHGHWGTTIERENPGTGEVELRRTIATYLNSVSDAPAAARWILDPLLTHTVSRPFRSGVDVDPVNLSTTESFTYDGSGFLTKQEIRTTDSWTGYADSRVRTVTFTPGTSSSAPCLFGGTSSTECGNKGFPISRTEAISGALNGVLASGSYTRKFFYRFGTLAAAYDQGTSFYAVDRDVAPTGTIIGERPSSGRTALSSSSPTLTTTFAYDLLGRLVSTSPPGEGPTTATYGIRSVTRTKAEASPGVASVSRIFFDDLGRPTVELRRMPAGGHSYRVTTLDPAGHVVGASEWQSIACAADNPCPGLDRVQAAISLVPSSGTYVSVPPGAVFGGFDEIDRPTMTWLADGAIQSDTYTGWWLQTTDRLVNTSPYSVPSTYEYERNSLGQLVRVKEPATLKADNTTTMNVAEETRYVYDHMGRLVSSAKQAWNPLTSVFDTQRRTTLFDDFGWPLLETTPEVPSTKCRKRDARGNCLIESVGYAAAGEIVRAYDLAGRHLTSTSSADMLYPFEQYYYDRMPPSTGYLGSMGASNGRLVWAVRMDHANSTSGPDFGWFMTQDLYHHTGLGGRLGFRQMTSYLIDGNPTVPPTAAPDVLAKKSSLRDRVRAYFSKTGRLLTTKDRSLASALTGPTPAGTQADAPGDPWAPSGWLRWSYSYDSAGRVASVRYPRRDEGTNTATVVSYSYDAGLPVSVSAAFKDPFWGSSAVETAVASLAYNASGSVKSTALSSQASSRVFELATPDQLVTAGQPETIGRPGTWKLSRTPSNTNVEERALVYDPSGNLSSIGSATYRYDTRNRLIADSLLIRATANKIETREYDGFGNLSLVSNAYGARSFVLDRTNNRIAGGMVWDAPSGRLLFDRPANSATGLQHDYYPDGHGMAEYQHAGTYTQGDSGISGSLYNGAGERIFSFWGVDGRCDTEFFLHTPRDEGGRILTEYQAEAELPCSCNPGCTYFDRYQKDYVWIGGRALVTYKRNQGSRFAALNHLGSTEYVFDRWGAVVARVKLDSFGGELGSTVGAERHRFAGHERDHVTDLDGPGLPISDNMHARTYVPMLGRFTRPDPAKSFSLFDPQSLNRYAYARNNPVLRIDPDGRADYRTIGEKAVLDSPKVLQAVGLMSLMSRFDKPVFARRESGTTIVRTTTGEISTTPVIPGRTLDVDLLKIRDGKVVHTGQTGVAYMHAHPGEGLVPGTQGDPVPALGGSSSPKDREAANASEVNSYILNGTKELFVYDPSTGRDRPLLTESDYQEYLERANSEYVRAVEDRTR